MQIEIDSRCNLRCRMCAVPQMAARRPRTIGPSDLRELLQNHFAHAAHVTFCGFSEPLMNPDVPELVRVARSLGKQVNLATNGMLLTPGLATELVAAGLDDVALSFDTTDSRAFHLIRGVDRWSSVVANLRALRAAIDRAGAPLRIELHAVVSGHTLGEVETLVRFAAAEGVQLVTFIREMPFAGQDVTDLWRDFAAMDWTAVAELARDLGVALSFTDPRVDAAVGCYWASAHSYVSIEGDVSPCQVASADPAARFGNVREASFSSIFAGERYAAFRHAVARGELPPACRGCSCVFRSGPEQLAGEEHRARRAP